MSRIRQVTVEITGVKDYETGASSTKSITSTGASNEIAIIFNVQKHITGSPNVTEISITNLSPDLRQKLAESILGVKLYAGYVGEELTLVSKGGVLNCTSSRAGDSEIITKLNILDGYGPQLRGFYNQAIAGGVSVDSVIRELAATLENVSIGEINVAGVIAEKGRVFYGSTVDTLDKLARNFKFSWSIQDGVFQALDDEVGSTKLYVFRSNQNLISAQPLINGPLQQRVGVDIVSILDPRVKPGDKIRLESTINPILNKIYKVTEIQLSGATHADAWQSQIKCFINL